MNVVFRADASASIGTGHVSRCLTLAEALKKREVSVTFVCASGSPDYAPRLLTVPDKLIELSHTTAEFDDPTRPKWLLVDEVADAEATLAALENQAFDWLVVDHYGLSSVWEAIMRSAAERIFVIDDLADRPHDCDILLDQNLRANSINPYAELVPPNTQVLLGPRYALLRDEFITARAANETPRTILKRILVSFGGVDSANLTSVAVDALARLRDIRPAVDVVIGQGHPRRDEVANACAQHGFNLQVQTSSIACLMSSADLAIGASGASAWERCFVGLPSIALVVADNQRAVASGLAACGAAIILQAPGDSVREEIVTRTRAIAKDPGILSDMSRAAYAITAHHRDVCEYFLQ